jgi:ribonuclease HI
MTIIIHTSASQHDNVGGYAAVIKGDGHDYEISGHFPTDNAYATELMAVLEGIRATPEGSEVIVKCDVAAIVKQVNRISTGHELDRRAPCLDLWGDVEKEMQQRHVRAVQEERHWNTFTRRCHEKATKEASR